MRASVVSHGLTAGLASALALACVPATLGPSSDTGPAADPEGADRASADPHAWSGALYPVALREGSIDLVVTGGRAYAVLEGEPVPLSPGQAPARVGRLGHGIAPIVALGGGGFTTSGLELRADLDAGVLVLREDFDRAGIVHHVYALGSTGWQRSSDARGGPLVEFFAAVVELDGALLGLRGYELADGVRDTMTEDSPAAEQLWAEVQRARAEAPTGFVAIHRRPSVPPSMPEGWELAHVSATRDGRLVALGSRPADEGPFTRARVLTWAPNARLPTVAELPGLATEVLVPDLDLTVSGAAALIHGAVQVGDDGSELYLAIDTGSGWDRIAVDLPGSEGLELEIRAVTLGPGGEPWIAVADWGGTGFPSLWRRASAGWESLALPDLGPTLAAADAHDRFVFDPTDGTWLDAPAAGPGRADADGRGVEVEALATVDDVVWVAARVGRSYPTADELYLEESRTGLFATAPVDGDPVWLTGYDRLQLERLDARAQAPGVEPGGPRCLTVSVVLLADPDATPDLRDKLLGFELDALSVSAGYVRERLIGAPLDQPDRIELVARARVASPAVAAALRAHVREQTGIEPTLDCRPRALIRRVD